MASKQELFTKVTGLTFDVEKITDDKKLSWLIPAGAMLENPEGRKAKDTEEFKSVAGLETNPGYDDIEDQNEENSFDDVNENESESDKENSTAEVIDLDGDVDDEF